MILLDLCRFKNTEREYYRVRNSRLRTNACRAARLLFLTRLSFNSIYRVNLNGDFNVPYGHKRHLSVCAVSEIRRASRVLRNATFRVGDFER